MISFLKCTLPFLLLLLACKDINDKTVEEIINKSIEVSGFNTNEIDITFDFRAYHYEFFRKGYNFTYARTTIKDDKKIRDELSSTKGLKRFIDSVPESLTDSLAMVYSNSLNSVMYFFQLPKPLLDGAVHSELLDEIKIEEGTYWTIKVSFSEEGGGEDYQDEYRYWINQDTYEIDYLAYNYTTEGGGIRFRKAIKKKRVKGILFQDYKNFRPSNKYELLDNLPQIYEEGLLSQISLIENKNIIVQ
jgi:hypothetical protein